MSTKAFVDQMRVKNPCSASWDAMVGNDQFRFCEHCNLGVYNLAQMTRKEVERLIAKSNGRLCVRYQRRPGGSVQTLPAKQKLHRIARRASQFAASTFSATLAVTGGTLSQSEIVAAVRPVALRLDSTHLLGGVVVGIVKDQNGAVVTSASVNLTSDQKALSFYSSVSMSGEFRFEGLQPGMYSLRIEAPGFASLEPGSFYVAEDTELRLDQTLEVATIQEFVDVEGGEQLVVTSTGGAIAIVAPSDPFIRAVQQDEMQEATRLLAGRDVNLRDKSSNTTALEHAVRNANREMVQMLIGAGAKVNLRNEAGQTVLMMLDDDATSDLVWDLVNAGAKVNAKDRDGETPLMSAARVNNVELLKTLLEAGAEVNARNERKQTALMDAADYGYVNIVRALILAGAEVNAVDGEGKNALSYAVEAEHATVGRLLRSHGVIEVAKKIDKEN
jgi:ankyrin repeat protein/carboxypeptidase family protein